jgi:hypothetical protein
MKNQKTQFATELENEMLETVRRARLDGTTSMSVDCLRQCVLPPSFSIDGAPRGTNCRYYYAQLFREIIRLSPPLSSFTRSCEPVQCRD